MWQRFSLYDVRVIGHYLGMLVLFSALLMVVPFVTALVFQEWDPAYRYLYSIGIALVVGSLLRFFRIQPGKLNRQQALAVVGLAWIVLGLFCSIPLYNSGHYLTYLDALFDSVSGITTTGASLIVDLDHLSYADNMFRFMMHLLGGLGLIVVALSLGVFGKRAGATLYTSEGRSEHVVPNVIHTTTFIAKVTAWFVLIGTVSISVLMLLSGIEPVRAILQSFWVAISGFVTGGFSPMQQSIWVRSASSSIPRCCGVACASSSATSRRAPPSSGWWRWSSCSRRRWPPRRCSPTSPRCCGAACSC